MKIKKNGKVITLTESDLNRIVKRVLNEEESSISSGSFKNIFPSSIGEFEFEEEARTGGGRFYNCLYTYTLKDTARTMHNPTVYFESLDGGKTFDVNWSLGSESVPGSKQVISIGKQKLPEGKYNVSDLSKAISRFKSWANGYVYGKK